MLIDKKLEATLPAIDLLKNTRPYASGLVLACVAVCLWNTLSTRSTVFQRRQADSGRVPSFSLRPVGRGSLKRGAADYA
jgi:hypothetical protein